MPYRVKDLMINVMPRKGDDDKGHGGVLTHYRCDCGCTLGYTPCALTLPGQCTPAVSMQGCGDSPGPTVTRLLCPAAVSIQGCGDTPGPGGHQPCPAAVSTQGCGDTVGPMGLRQIFTDPVANPAGAAEQIAVLKAHLQNALEELEKEEKAVHARLQPQSVDEIDHLQTKLKEAQDDLEKRKQELQPKSAPDQK